MKKETIYVEFPEELYSEAETLFREHSEVMTTFGDAVCKFTENECIKTYRREFAFGAVVGAITVWATLNIIIPYIKKVTSKNKKK